MNLPAESAELLFPIEYEGWDFRDDSGGPASGAVASGRACGSAGTVGRS